MIVAELSSLFWQPVTSDRHARPRDEPCSGEMLMVRANSREHDWQNRRGLSTVPVRGSARSAVAPKRRPWPEGETYENNPDERRLVALCGDGAGSGFELQRDGHRQKARGGRADELYDEMPEGRSGDF